MDVRDLLRRTRFPSGKPWQMPSTATVGELHKLEERP